MLLLASLIGLASGSSAQTVEQFYKGKTINVIVPFSPGGYYDLGARLLARHMGNHIPGNPQMVVQNQPGGGGIGLANRFGAGANNDGTTIAVLQRGLPLLALTGDKNVRFDPLTITWIGSISAYATDAFILAINASHPVKKVEDLLQPGVKLKVGANQSGSTNLTLAVICREILGLNYEIVRGYPGASNINLAQQSGEVDGQFADVSFFATNMKAQWDSKGLTPIVQLGRRTRLPSLPDVPMARELVNDPERKAFLEFAETPFFAALPVAAPVGLPKDRADALKAAFMATAKDEAFLGEAKRMQYTVDPISGDEVLAIIREAAKTPKHIIEKYKEMIEK
jgi:tripartite-type tricarboxylate transporter receptor subunit TctC